MNGSVRNVNRINKSLEISDSAHYHVFLLSNSRGLDLTVMLDSLFFNSADQYHRKLTHRISFPFEDLDLSEFCERKVENSETYELIGVVVN